MPASHYLSGQPVYNGQVTLPAWVILIQQILALIGL